jgi:hypothetical protein
MRPTIYVPSRPTRLLSRLALSLEDVLPPRPDPRGTAEAAAVALSTSKVGRMDFCCCAQS